MGNSDNHQQKVETILENAMQNSSLSDLLPPEALKDIQKNIAKQVAEGIIGPTEEAIRQAVSELGTKLDGSANWSKLPPETPETEPAKQEQSWSDKINQPREPHLTHPGIDGEEYKKELDQLVDNNDKENPESTDTPEQPDQTEDFLNNTKKQLADESDFHDDPDLGKEYQNSFQDLVPPPHQFNPNAQNRAYETQKNQQEQEQEENEGPTGADEKKFRDITKKIQKNAEKKIKPIQKKIAPLEKLKQKYQGEIKKQKRLLTFEKMKFTGSSIWPGIQVLVGIILCLTIAFIEVGAPLLAKAWIQIEMYYAKYKVKKTMIQKRIQFFEKMIFRLDKIIKPLQDQIKEIQTIANQKIWEEQEKMQANAG